MKSLGPLDDCIAKYNLCNRSAKKFPEDVLTNGDTWASRAEHWRKKAESHAEALGTRLVPVPGNPEVLTAELYVRLLEGTTE